MSTWKRTAVLTDAGFETREADGQRMISGYFAVFDGQYWLWDQAYETIDTGAFDLAADNDVRALTNHDTTLVLGRTTVGTLTLRVDEQGLGGTILINDKDQDAINLYERVKRGDVSQCSFGFDILDEKREVREDGIIVYHLRKVKLWEVSICTFPAYENTGVQSRKADEEEIQRRQAEEARREAAQRQEAWREAMRQRLKRAETPEE